MPCVLDNYAFPILPTHDPGLQLLTLNNTESAKLEILHEPFSLFLALASLFSNASNGDNSKGKPLMEGGKSR